MFYIKYFIKFLNKKLKLGKMIPSPSLKSAIIRRIVNAREEWQGKMAGGNGRGIRFFILRFFFLF